MPILRKHSHLDPARIFNTGGNFLFLCLNFAGSFFYPGFENPFVFFKLSFPEPDNSYYYNK